MADNFEKIEQRLASLEQRMSRLEASGSAEKIVSEAKIKQVEEKEESGSGFPVGALVLLGIGGLILLNSVPSLIMRFFVYNSYSSYGRSYFDYNTLIFVAIGLFIFMLGVRKIMVFRGRKSSMGAVATKRSAGGVVAVAPLDIKGGQIPGTKSEEKRGDSIEYQIASHWFSIVGVIAILLGVALFLKYAFDSRWIGPVGQVSIGIIFGICFLGLGDFFRSKYAQYSQILTGCGIAVLYLSVWAAYAVFKLVDPVVVMGLMSLITISSALLAVRYNSIYVAALGLLGGFITPIFLAKGFDQVLLLTYILVLNFGVLTIAFFKDWKTLNLLAFAATYIDFSIWYSNYASKGQNTLEAIVFLTIFFAVFSLVWIIYNLVYDKKVEEVDIFLTLLNALVYFGFSYTILDKQYGDYLGFFAFAMALYYALFGYMAFVKFKADSMLTLGFLGSSILFLTIAVPLQVEKNLITIVWAIESAVLVWLSFWISSYKLRVAALGIYILVVIRLVAFDANLPLGEFALIFNKRFITYVIAAISAGIASYFYHVYRQNVQEDEKPVLPVLLIGLNVVLVAALTLESINYFDKKIEALSKQPKAEVIERDGFALVGDAYAQGATYVYWIHEKGQFESGCCLEVNPSAPTTLNSYTFTLRDRVNSKYYEGVVCSPNCDSRVIWTGPVLFAYNQTGGYSVTLGPSGMVNTGYINEPVVSNPPAYKTPVTYTPQNKPATYPQPVITNETLAEIKKLEGTRNVSISVIWLMYSLVMLMVGVVAKYKPIRLSALAFFAVTILKVFIIDSANLQQLFRIIAFIVLGTILLVVAYIYQRFKQQINAFLLNG